MIDENTLSWVPVVKGATKLFGNIADASRKWINCNTSKANYGWCSSEEGEKLLYKTADELFLSFFELYLQRYKLREVISYFLTEKESELFEELLLLLQANFQAYVEDSENKQSDLSKYDAVEILAKRGAINAEQLSTACRIWIEGLENLN